MNSTRREALRTLGANTAGLIVAACRDSRSRSAPATTSTAGTSMTPSLAAKAHPVVRNVDHLFAVFDDAPRAFEFMRAALGLPVAWPFADYGSFAGGGVNLGNVNFELVAARGPFVASDPARVTGLAFEPASKIDAAYGRKLDERGVAHGPAEPTPAWTNMDLVGLLDAGTNVFATDYRVPAVKDARARQRALDDVRGGRLGIVRITELVIGVADFDGAQHRWQSLLLPAVPDRAARWMLGRGPALRLVRHPRDEVLDVRFEARRPQAAARLGDLRSRDDPRVGLPLTCSAS